MRRWFVILALALGVALAQTTHTVQAGETLYRIALRYNTSVERLQALNNIADPTQLRVGQVLRVGGQPASRPTARRTDVPAPLSYVEWTPTVVQGNLAVLRLGSEQEISGQVRFLGGDYPINRNRALLPVPALQAPGAYAAVFYLGGQEVRLPVRVAAGTFGRFVLQLPPEREALLVPERLRAERQKVVGACDPARPQQWAGSFRKPVDSNRITDPFGTRRSYDRGATYSFHEGIDYGVPVGTPLYAPAAGVVVLAETLFVRGGAVVIDHGAGVCSGHWHLSKIVAKPGQAVKPGDLIAYTGNTGLSNGPHAHYEIRVRGVPTNPAPWYFQAP